MCQLFYIEELWSRCNTLSHVRNGMEDGARGRNRTNDTAIFSRMLYQLSYPGAHAAGG